MMHNKGLKYLIILLLSASCRPHVFTPKPTGFFKIDTPATHQYRLFSRPDFPYSFEYPVYSNVIQDTMNRKLMSQYPYWVNIVFPELEGMINITYLDINSTTPLDKLNEDSWSLSFAHHDKMDSLGYWQCDDKGGTKGVLLILGGNTASRYQFVVSDSLKHFIRGALYFNATPNADSLKPATDFLETDIKHMMSTIKWKTPGKE